MATTAFNSIDEYIATQPEAAQAVLQRVRSVIRKALPGAEEAISYRIPAFKLTGRPIIWFAGWARHYSLYPVNGKVVEAFKEDLAPYQLSKGTLRLPLSRPVPESLIRRIAKLRAAEAAKHRPSDRTPAVKAGKLEKGRAVVAIPPALRTALKAEPQAKAAFDHLAPSHRKAYAQWISSAKGVETRDRRARGAVKMLMEGKTLR
jgi:uncharacterized protein YdhG (YjbR/CyaY superfamily)